MGACCTTEDEKKANILEAKYLAVEDQQELEKGIPTAETPFVPILPIQKYKSVSTRAPVLNTVNETTIVREGDTSIISNTNTKIEN